jgi:hypothetical protein
MKARVRNAKRKIQTVIGWKHDRVFSNMHIDGVLDLSASLILLGTRYCLPSSARRLAAVGVGSGRKQFSCQALHTNYT